VSDVGVVTFERVTDVGEEVRAEIEQLWFDVSEAGGAVGFVPPVERHEVADALAAALGLVERGNRLLGVLHVDDRLAGFGFLSRRSDRPLVRHWATVLAVQVHPRHQGQGLGRLLMEGLHDLALEAGLEFLHLTYRDGTGLGDFYAGLGYHESGRIPGALRVAPGDDRDEVLMVCDLATQSGDPA
jgi:GNAT superfamily N-acetyltransferase